MKMISKFTLRNLHTRAYHLINGADVYNPWWSPSGHIPQVGPFWSELVR